MEEKISTCSTWVARDLDGTLAFFETKPIKSDSIWVCSDSTNVTSLLGEEFLFKFPNIKWEDKEPTKVELTIKICE